MYSYRLLLGILFLINHKLNHLCTVVLCVVLPDKRCCALGRLDVG